MTMIGIEAGEGARRRELILRHVDTESFVKTTHDRRGSRWTSFDPLIPPLIFSIEYDPEIVPRKSVRWRLRRNCEPECSNVAAVHVLQVPGWSFEYHIYPHWVLPAFHSMYRKYAPAAYAIVLNIPNTPAAMFADVCL